MYKRLVVFGVFILLTAAFWVTTTVADPQPPKKKREFSEKRPDDAQVTFGALKEKLPGIVSAWCESAFVLKPQVRIARRTSSEEAKITFEGIAAIHSSECFFTLYLRYYDGAWSVIRWEAGGNAIDQERIRGVYAETGASCR
jgi:hypothetical protein